MNSPVAAAQRNRMAEFQRKPRTALVALVITDLMDWSPAYEQAHVSFQIAGSEGR
jgi:hypothetical protein